MARCEGLIAEETAKREADEKYQYIEAVRKRAVIVLEEEILSESS